MRAMTPREAVQALYKVWQSDPAIARLAGTSQSTISRLRRGRIKGCDYELGRKLVELARAGQPSTADAVAGGDS